MTNSSYAHLRIHTISWHLFHGIHLPLGTSMIRGEIKLFIILFLRPLLVAPHLKQHSGILMLLSGNDDQQKSLDFAAEQTHERRSSVWNKSLHETFLNMLISHIKQHVQQGFFKILRTLSQSVTEKKNKMIKQQHNFPGIIKVNTNKSQLVKYYIYRQYYTTMINTYIPIQFLIAHYHVSCIMQTICRDSAEYLI